MMITGFGFRHAGQTISMRVPGGKRPTNRSCRHFGQRSSCMGGGSFTATAFPITHARQLLGDLVALRTYLLVLGAQLLYLSACLAQRLFQHGVTRFELRLVAFQLIDLDVRGIEPIRQPINVIP
jgi:hypothetical protein